MTFILSEQRDRETRLGAAFGTYRAYLEDNRDRFPGGAYALARSEWYYDPTDHRCPHDAWLERLIVSETSSGSRSERRHVAVSVELLGAYHDLMLRFDYEIVYGYSIQLGEKPGAHGDWRYDEFRLTDDNHLIHEIEWVHGASISRWKIEAADVRFSSNERTGHPQAFKP